MDQALAAAFHRRAKVSRIEFGVDVPALRPSSAPQHVDIAVPGFAGAQYQPGGLCLISVNPAGGKDAYSPAAGDEAIYEASAALAEAIPDQAEAEFQALARAFVTAMPTWGAQWRHVSAIIDATNVSLSALAYVYLVPFRTRDDKGSSLPPHVLQKGVRHGFYEILDVLQARTIIAMDRPSQLATSGWAAKRPVAPTVQYYTRKRDDHAGRAAMLDRLRAELAI